MYSIHIADSHAERQKLTQHCKAIILQLKTNKKKTTGKAKANYICVFHFLQVGLAL